MRTRLRPPTRPGRLAALTVTAGLTAAGAAGCRDATSPPPQAAGTYALRSVGGQPLPVVVIRDSLATTAVLADTLTLRGDGTFTEREVLLNTPAASQPAPATQVGAATGVWSRSGATISARVTAGYAPFVAVSTYTLGTGNTLTVNRVTGLGPNGYGADTPFVYER